MPDQFWFLRPSDFDRILRITILKRDQDTEEKWQRMRLQTWYLLNVQLDKKHRISTPEKLFRLTSEQVEERQLTEDEIAWLKEDNWDELDDMFKQLKKKANG
jgi:hypothetical protein